MQVLGLLHSAQGREDFVKVAMVTMSVMLTRQRDLAMKYLIGPLVEPLSQLSSGGCGSGEGAMHTSLA